jgi:branched-chain amino acid transport system ATP-binding protein
MLQLENIQASYGSSQVLFGMSLELHAGEVVTMIGRNGMGKTTTINSLMGIIPSSGAIQFRSIRIDSLPSYQRARLGLGLVPEGRQVFPKLTVRENLIATARCGRAGPAKWTLSSVYRLFPRLSERSEQISRTLSGGEQQMLAIGRALMTNPSVLILDEASEGLAPLIRAEIWACLAELKQSGQSMLVIDKNLAEISRIADRHYVVEKGRVVWAGSNDDLKRDEGTLQKYLSV